MKIIVMLIMLTLSGCATTQPLQVTSGCPKPVIPAEPRYPVQDLKKGDERSTVAKAYVASLHMCIMDNEAVRHVCGGYK
jgi:uncharacterized protein YceK